MTRFRASDEQLDREIAALERIALVRLGRATRELREIEKDLRELKKEKARRVAEVEQPVVAAADEPATG